MIEVLLHVDGYPDSDAEERAELAWRLREELLGLDCADVSRPALESPAGAKGAALDWAQLVVTLLASLPPLVVMVRSWRKRHPQAAITLEIDGDRLTLDDSSDSERKELIDAWMQRHGG